MRAYVRTCVRACVYALPLTVDTSGSSLTHACIVCVCVPVVCALSVVLRYHLFIAMATMCQFVDVAWSDLKTRL